MGKGPGKKEEQVMSKFIEEILNNIVEYYQVNPRGLRNWGCTYKGCAVGLACGFNVDDWDTGVGGLGGAIDTVHREYVNNQRETEFWDNFLPEYRYEEVQFWEEVQVLHDTDTYWKQNDQGGQDLTETGRAALEDILWTFD